MLSHFSHVQIFVTLWTVAHQAPLSMAFSRQKYLSELPGPPPGDLLNPGIEPLSLMSPALASGFFTTSTAWEVPYIIHTNTIFLLEFPQLYLHSRFGTVHEKQMKVKVKVNQSSPTLCNPMVYLVHGIHQSKNTGVGSLSLLQ